MNSNMWPEMIVRVYLTSAVQISILMIWIMIHTCLLAHKKTALTIASRETVPVSKAPEDKTRNVVKHTITQSAIFRNSNALVNIKKKTKLTKQSNNTQMFIIKKHRLLFSRTRPAFKHY